MAVAVCDDRWQLIKVGVDTAVKYPDHGKRVAFKCERGRESRTKPEMAAPISKAVQISIRPKNDTETRVDGAGHTQHLERGKGVADQSRCQSVHTTPKTKAKSFMMVGVSKKGFASQESILDGPHLVG